MYVWNVSLYNQEHLYDAINNCTLVIVPKPDPIISAKYVQVKSHHWQHVFFFQYLLMKPQHHQCMVHISFHLKWKVEQP